MENPSTCYIRAGYGWTGTAGTGVSNLTISNCRGYTSGSVTVSIGIDVKNSIGTEIKSSPLALIVSANCYLNLTGTNTNTFVGQTRESFGATYPWVKNGGVQELDAGPIMDWQQGFINENIYYITRSSVTVTLDNQVSSTQGGFYNAIGVGSATAVTVTKTSAVPAITGKRMSIIAIDSNVTLAHAGGAVGQFILLGAANLTLTNGIIYTFIYNGSTGNWVQV
jgi:hypothetical protein